MPIDVLQDLRLEDQHKICELYEQGYSYGKVIRMIGPIPRASGKVLPISERAVKVVLDHYNVPIRSAAYVGRGNKYAKTSLEQWQDA